MFRGRRKVVTFFGDIRKAYTFFEGWVLTFFGKRWALFELSVSEEVFEVLIRHGRSFIFEACPRNDRRSVLRAPCVALVCLPVRCVKVASVRVYGAF